MNPAAIRKRLASLQAKYGGEFYWKNGIVRHVTLHPTKGYRNTRWDVLPLPAFGLGYIGLDE